VPGWLGVVGERSVWASNAIGPGPGT
jgi:hypothetical protein